MKRRSPVTLPRASSCVGRYTGTCAEPSFADAAVRVRTALGMSKEPKADLELFKAIVNGQVPQATSDLAAAPPEAAKSAK